MRVISGCVRGLKLVSPEGINTRPTLDRVKEAVFSMLLPYVCEAKVLDVFAGSGAMGIEAISRGAQRVVFVDNSREAVKCIKTNLTSAKMTDKALVHQNDALEYLAKTDERFDLIFLDPPYSKGLYDGALKLIGERQLLSSGGLLIAEWDFEVGFTDKLYGFDVLKEKKYGRVGITVLKRG